MGNDNLLTVRDTAAVLGISEKEVINLAEGGVIPAYKIDGVYLRFKKDQILEFKKTPHPILTQKEALSPDSTREKLFDFLYLNDFYIVTVLIILALLFVIFRGY